VRTFGRQRGRHDPFEVEPRLTRRACLLLVGLLVLLTPAAQGADAPPPFRIIAHPSLKENAVARQFLADAFLKNVTRWPGGTPIRPVDQRPDTQVRKDFSDAVLKRSVQAVKAHWQQRIFSGRGVPPPALDSDQAVVDYVAKHEGAVGYVGGTAALDKTKVITVNP